MFESNPEKSIIPLKDKCSECGREGGALFKYLSDGYLMKCPDCYQTTSKIDGN